MASEDLEPEPKLPPTPPMSKPLQALVIALLLLILVGSGAYIVKRQIDLTPPKLNKMTPEMTDAEREAHRIKVEEDLKKARNEIIKNAFKPRAKNQQTTETLAKTTDTLNTSK